MEVNSENSAVLYDNIDTRSVSSCVSSNKNAEMIAAAFGCGNAGDEEEEADEEEEEEEGEEEEELNINTNHSIVSNETNTKKNANDKNKENVKSSNSSGNSSTNGSLVNARLNGNRNYSYSSLSNGTLTTTIIVQPNKEDLITISTSDEDPSNRTDLTSQPEIQKKKSNLSEKQQSHYLKLKKLRENEKKKKELIRLERSKKLEIARAKRKKRMKKGVENDQDNQKQVDEENENEEEDEEYNQADATKNNSQDDQSGSESLTTSQTAKSTETQKNQHRLQQQQPVKMKRFRRTKQQILLDKQLAMQNTLNRQIQKMKSPISSPTKKSMNAVALPRTINKNNNYNTTNNKSNIIDANTNRSNITEPNFYGIPIIQSANRRRKKVYRTKPKNCAKIKSKEFILDDDDEDEEYEEESSFVSSNGQKTATNSPTKTPSVTNTPKQPGKQSEDEEEEEEDDESDDEEEEGIDEKKLEDEENEQDEEEEDEDVSTLFRKCLVCKVKVHQDFLADHCGDHFYESPKCKRCDKISSNPSNYVTHILSHLMSQFYCVKCDKWFRQPIVFRRHQRECLIITMPQRNEEAEEEDNDDDNDLKEAKKKEHRNEKKNKNPLNHEIKKESEPVFSSRSSSPTKSPVKLEISKKATAGKRKLSLQNSIVNEQENKRTRLARTASAIALTAFKIPEPILPGVKRRLGRPPKNPKPVDNSLKPEEEQQDENPKEDEKKINTTSKSLIPPLTLPKSKRLLSKLITSQMAQSSQISTLKPTPASSASAAEHSPKKQKKKPGPKPKSSRLSSVSSIGSSSQSSNSKQLARSTTQSGRPTRQLAAVDFEDTNNQSQDDDLDLDDDEIDEIDDIAVSDYEMDENTNASKQSTDTTTGGVAAILVTNTVANIKQETTLKSSNTNLSLTQTYKVKIQLCRPPSTNTATSSNQLQASTSAASAVASATAASAANSSSTPSINSTTPSSKQHKEKENESILPLTPLKANAFVLNTPTATPSKQIAHMNSNLSINASQNEPTESTNQNTSNTNNSNVTTYFECPECDKKFVSQYGLLQHYDQHPTLAVTCSLCQITFENHHVLILHYKNAHNIKEKSERDSTANSNSKQQLNVVKKPDVKQKTFKSSAKSKQTSEDLIDVTGNIANDLSALPSIMTRTSRITNFGNNSNLNNSNHLNSTKPGLIAAAALLNHNLKYKTSGFADLSFIDFSCVNFPRIAQNFCEIWPRKLHAESTPQQPLHNYMCQKCGFYFPCKASLALHEMNKKFATSKLKTVTREVDSDQEKKKGDQAEKEDERVNKIDNKKKITSRCELFMTNSKYLCYEKCLDEIITKIEDSFKSEDDDQEDKTCEFLKSFGLVPTKSLPVAAEGTEKKDQEKYLNLTEKLMLKLREQMLDINYQFIIDLDRWKFMHSTASVSTSATESNSEQSNDYYFHDTNKIHLKPHINLNRPLLIRSKKLKRNTFKASQTTIAAAAVTAAANKLHQRAQAAKSPQPQPQPSQPQQLNTFKSLLNAINSVNITSSTAKSSEVKTSHSNTTPKFSKPFFSATSGNFSAAVVNNNKSKSSTPVILNSMLVAGKKRKLIQMEKRKRLIEKKQKQKEEENEEEVDEEEEEEDDKYQEIDEEETGENKEFNESLSTNKRDTQEEKIMENGSYEGEDIIPLIQDEKMEFKVSVREDLELTNNNYSNNNSEKDDENDIQLIEEINNLKPKESLSKIKNISNSSIHSSNPPPLLCQLQQQRRIASAVPNIRSTLPLVPPPLYKAPTSNNHFNLSSSAATSSILASASGMSNHHIYSKTSNNNKNNSNNNNSNISMPKLQPAAPNKIRVNSQLTTNPSNYASLMPKLKPSIYTNNNNHNTYNNSNINTNHNNQVNKQLRPALPPPPPLTLMNPKQHQQQQQQQQSQQITKKQKKETVSEHSQHFKQTSAIAQFQNKSQSINNSTAAASLNQNQHQQQQQPSKTTNKSSENLSLKCKFCFEVFKGQSEFFQHVIVSHPKMLEQRLNRPTSKSTNTTSPANSNNNNNNSNNNNNNTNSSNTNSNSNSSNSSSSSISSNNNSQDNLFRAPTTSAASSSSIGASHLT